MDHRIRYVAGFLFTEDRKHVALVRKRRPRWQAQKLNGIGGHVEAGESFEAAMVREFQEETGLTITNWEPTVVMSDLQDRFELRFFRAFSDEARNVQSMTDEIVGLYPVDDLPNLQVIPNLLWLIPLHLDPHVAMPMAVCNQGGN